MFGMVFSCALRCGHWWFRTVLLVHTDAPVLSLTRVSRAHLPEPPMRVGQGGYAHVRSDGGRREQLAPRP